MASRRIFCKTGGPLFVHWGALVKSPFQTNPYGEALPHAFTVRDSLARIAGYSDLQSEDPHSSNSSLQIQRFRCAAWCLWRQYPTRVYLHQDAIKAFCNKCPTMPLDEMIGRLVQHAREPSFFTSPALKKAEDNVRNFLLNAQALGIEHRPSSKLDANQNEIVASVLQSGASVIVGGAGVGKTTTIGSIVQQASESMVQVVCMAYTHKARRAMASKLIGDDEPRHESRLEPRVSTIHSFIGTMKSNPASGAGVKTTTKAKRVNKITSFFKPVASSSNNRDEDAANNARVDASSRILYILDEASMIDLQLLSELADVIKCCNKYQVCFVGDDGQLPPMSRGEVFRQLTLPDLIEDPVSVCRIHSFVKVHRLVTCYRTNNRKLFDACQALRQGRLVIDDKDSADPSWEVHLASTDADVYTELRRRIRQIDVEGGSLPQYIAWQNKDVRKINDMVQEHLLDKGMLDARDVWQYGSTNRFHKGDKVVYVGDNIKKNGMELTNAMTGNVVSAGIGGMTIVWEGSDGGQVTTMSASVKSVPAPNDVQLAYCVTVHKSQGSEHDVIIVPCLEVEKMKLCLDRRWLYTAATRAKQRAVIIATPNISGFVSKSVSAIPLNSLFDQ